MNRIRIALAALIVPMALVATATPADADTPGCVSDGEYRNTDPGERQASVHKRFDTAGWLVDTTYANGYRYQHRQYVKCYASDAYGNRVNVEYRTPIADGTAGYNRVVRKWRSQD